MIYISFGKKVLDIDHDKARILFRLCQTKSKISPGEQIYETISIYCWNFLGAGESHASQNLRHLYRHHWQVGRDHTLERSDRDHNGAKNYSSIFFKFKIFLPPFDPLKNDFPRWPYLEYPRDNPVWSPIYIRKTFSDKKNIVCCCEGEKPDVARTPPNLLLFIQSQLFALWTTSSGTKYKM